MERKPYLMLPYSFLIIVTVNFICDLFIDRYEYYVPKPYRLNHFHAFSFKAAIDGLSYNIKLSFFSSIAIYIVYLLVLRGKRSTK